MLKSHGCLLECWKSFFREIKLAVVVGREFFAQWEGGSPFVAGRLVLSSKCFGDFSLSC